MSASSGAASASEAKTSTSSPVNAGASSDSIWAYTILRVSFGANIMLHGVSRFLMGHAAFLAYLTHYFEKTTVIPASTLPAFATVLPWVETFLGLLLMIGLATHFALIAGALVITCLVIGTNLAQDWLVSGLQLIYAFLYYYLLAHRDENRWSVDALSGK